MEGQSAEDKLSVLNTIFGNDLTQSTITRTLQDNNDAFDPTVEKLLTLPANKQHTPAPQPPQQQPMDPATQENIKRLHNMFNDLSQSIITDVYETNKRDVDGTVDTLLNMTSNEVAGGRRDNDVAHQEQEMKAYEEFKRLQAQLEQERRANEISQQKAREEEQKKKRAAEEEAKKKLEEARKEEHNKALQEQEKMLLEFQRKKAEEEEKKKMMEREKEGRLKVEEALRVERLKTEEELRKRKIEEEKRIQIETAKRMEEEKKREDERRKSEAKILLDQRDKERIMEEKRIALKKLEEENQRLQHQKELADNERKIIETRMKEELKREEEERKKLTENERKLREEQESVRKDWEEKIKKLETERRVEEQKRAQEEEERVKKEDDMRRILEIQRLKLEEQKKKVEEERKLTEEKLKAMEIATKRREEEAKKREEEAKRREEEEIRRKSEEEERKRTAEEQKKREEEEREKLLKEEAEEIERRKKEASNVRAQEQFAASAVMIPPAPQAPKVEVLAIVEGNEIKGAWTLSSGNLPENAWLGLFAKRSINTNSGYMYLGKDKTSGEFSFKNLTPGHYEVRVFSAKSVTERITETAPLRVGPSVITFNLQIQEGQLAINYELDPPATPTNKDWIGIYQKENRKNREYLSSTYGNGSGTVLVQIPKTPGVYEARLFAAGSKYNDSGAQEFVVEDHDRITVEHTENKETVKARWVMRTVETSSSDWIGLFAIGEPSQKYLVSVYTNGASCGSADISIPKELAAGSYELRLFSYSLGKYTPFKTSNIITF